MARTLSSRLSNAPIRLKVVIISLMVSVTTLLFAFALFALYQLTSYKQDHLDTLVSIAEITAYNISAPIGFNDIDGVTENYARVRQLDFVEMLQVLDEKDRLLAGYGLPDSSPPANNLYLQVSSATHAADYSYVFHDSHVDLRVPVMHDGIRVGSLVLRSNLAPVYAQLYNLLLICGAMFIGSIFVAYFVTTALQRFISAPLLAFRNTVELVKTTGDYSIRVPRTTNDETGVLISGFNSMLEEIKKRDDSLEQNRRNLEQTIHERTLGMEAALREVTREKDRAELANQAKSEFIAMMSHEIRTPMNGILGMISMLADAELPDEYRRYARTAQESCEVLLILINDILDFSRIETGNVELLNEPFDLAQLLENTASLFRNETGRKNLELVVETSSLPKHILRGDAARIRQILINLLGNAIKFTDEGRITIRGEQVSHEDHEYLIRLTVADTGRGIAREQQHRIFNAFAKADSSTTHKSGGSGLGLAICKKIASLMHGRIGVESQPDTGSSFWLELPLQAAEAGTGKAMKVAGKKPASGASLQQNAEKIGSTNPRDLPPLHLNILLVEDNGVNQMVAQEILKKIGCISTIAEHGLEALNLYEQQNFDAILMDCLMPVMDGYQATREIRILEMKKGLSRTPIIALTANAISGDREKVLAAGMDDYLSKPCRLQDIHAALLRNTANVARPAASGTGDPGLDNDQLLNLQVLADLGQLQGADERGMLRTLLDLYFDNSRTLLTQVIQSLDAAETEKLVAAAHSLKSISLATGGQRLGKLCGAIEQAARKGNLAEARRLAMLLAGIHAETVKALQDHLKKSGQ